MRGFEGAVSIRQPDPATSTITIHVEQVIRESPTFQEIIRAAKADAFDQGAQAQADGYGMQVDTVNPYRAQGEVR